MLIYAPLLICIIGLFIYLAFTGKVEQVGIKMFFAGLLVTLFQVANHTINVLK